MKRFFFLLSLLISFSIGQIWADDPAPAGTTLISENFSSYSANDVPSGSVTTTTGRVVYGGGNVNYSCTASGTKIYNENTGGGTAAPEILIAKNGGTFVIAGIPSGGAKAITVSFTQNKQALSVDPSGTGYSGSISGKPSAVGTRTFDITVADGAAATFTLVFKGSGTSNVRVDDILVTVKTAGEGGGTPTCATPTFSPAAGSYEGTQNVTISSTAGATIYYTTDGTTPSTSSSVYSEAIPVSANTTIKAYAVKTDYNDSEVATAAYTIIEGPDVTLDLLDGNWGFPTSNATGTETYTNSVTGYSVTCYAPTNYKVSGSSYFYLGKSGAYIELPSFSSPIEKIVVTGNSGASTGVIWNIFKGDDAVSTAATGCAESSYTFNIDPEEANVTYTLKVTSAHNLQIKAIKIFFGTAPAVAKPTISGDENFVTSTTVTLSHADADHIYYTTNGDAPTTSSAEYATPFSLTNTATVKAIAVKGSDVSAVAEKTFTKVEALESMEALLNATTSTETAFNVVVTDWVVTGVNGNRAWIADAANEKGILLYKSGHGFVAGNKLNGVVIGTKTKLYQGYPEMTTLVSTDVTVTTAETVSPRTTTIAALTSGYNAEQGTVVKLEGVTYSSSVLSDGVNSIAADNKLFSSLALIEGTTYDITGVVEYENNSVIKIMPRSADDVEAQTPVVIPTAANLAALKAAARGTYILTLSNAVVSYVNGNNAFIEDATGGALIFFANHGYSAGDCLNGDYQVTTTDYQGKFEITAMEAQTGAAKTTAEIPLTTVTITALNANFSSYESRRVKIVGANVTDAISGSDRNGAINDGAALAVYAAVASTITLTANDNVDIIGYPGFHNTDQQLTVWAQADITVNEKEDPELAFDPAIESVAQGDPWSTPTFTNPHSLDVTFSSNNEAVATVSNTGVVALEGGLGTAVITAHTDGDATYAAGNATYTITVNEAGTYSMSFDLTKVSYDDAADAEVVWNSNVVTITAQQGTGTKVTNYLAGNYSGTTLIEETRLYENNILTFTPKTGVTITKVEWIATAKAYAESLAKEGTTTAWTNATAALDAEYTTNKKVIITPSAEGAFSAVLGKSGSNKGTRGASVVVYYTAESEKSKLTASIAIDDMNMAVGDDDILLSAIAATSNPNKKAISYAVTSGTAVSIVGEGAEAALHAVEEGEATITATIPDNLGNYTGATKTFTVTVAAAATLVSIAISGDASVLEYTEGQDFNPAGLVVTGTYSDASTAPISEGITWAYDPSPLTQGTTSVSVTATVSEISSSAFVVNGLTVSAPAPLGDNYVKVTASQADWSGDYILVYEDGIDAYVWNGDYEDGANNYASATISSNTIAKPAAAAVITIAAASEGKYTLQVNGDKYFKDNGSNSKLIFTDAIADAAEVTISYETDWTKLLFSARCIRFNNASGQTRFRFYAASSQQAVQLYKKESATPPTPDYGSYQRSGLTVGNYGTICLPKAGVISGAKLFEVAYTNGSMIYCDQILSGEMAAGVPYFFQATSNQLNVTYSSATVEETASNANGLYGFYDLDDEDATLPLADNASLGNYILYQNAIYLVDGRAATIANYRAYIKLAEVSTTEPTPASGDAPRRRVAMAVNGEQVATGIDAINVSDKPMKLMIDGQLFIIRGEKMYDITGSLIK